MKNKSPAGQLLLPNFKVRHDFEWFRTFTVRERLLILLGHNLTVKSQFFSAHHPGHVQPIFIGTLSKHLNPLEAIKDTLPPKVKPNP